MPNFVNKNNTTGVVLARGVLTLRKGITLLQQGQFDAALREFRSVVSSKHPRTSRLVRSVADFYAYNTERLRKEAKKVQAGNANVMSFPQATRGDAWSDVDIAAVLVAPTNVFTSRFLSRFLGRSPEAVRFQRRYAFSNALGSWKQESGERYTRYTQNQQVAQKLGLL